MSIADTILNTIAFAGGGRAETDNRVMRQQKIEENNRVLQHQRDADWFGRAYNDEKMKPHFKLDAKGVQFDALSAYNENPALVMEMFQGLPKGLLAATDEKGRRINVKPTAIRPIVVQGEEMYAVEVERPDGKRAPLTYRGTPAPDDNVVLMTADEVNGLASQRLASMVTSGAMSNPLVFGDYFSRIGGAAEADRTMRDQAIRDEVTKMIDTMYDDDDTNDDPEAVAAARELFQVLNSLEGEALENAAAEFGIDVEAVYADLEATVAALEQAASTPTAEEPAPATQPPGVQPRAPAGEVPPGPAPIPGVRPAMGAVSSDFTPPGPTPEQQQQAGAQFFGGLVERAQASPTFKAIADRVSGIVSPDPDESSLSPELAEAPQGVQEAVLSVDITPEQRREALLKAIQEDARQPNSRQRELTRDYMISQRINSPQDLSNIPGPEVMNIAWVLAAADPGLTMDQRMKTAQAVINFANFGDVDMTPAKAAKADLDQRKFEEDLRSNAVSEQISLGNLNARYAELARGLGNDDAKAQEAMRELRTGVLDLQSAVSTGIPRNRRGVITGPPDEEANKALKQLLDGLDNAVQFGDPQMEAAYADGVNNALNDYVAAFIINEPAEFFDNWPLPVEGFMNFFGRAAFRNMDTDWSSYKIERDSKGRPKRLALVTPKGVKAEKGVISLTKLEQRLGTRTFSHFLRMLEEKEAERASEE